MAGRSKIAQITSTTSITASTNQAQGQGALTTSNNVITTCANDNDAVTMPPAVVGALVTVTNKGLKELQIHPASGDDIGLGVDISRVLEINESITFISRDGTTWDTGGTTQIAHAEMSDNDNTDAFVVTTQNVHEAYHSNAFVVGDLGGGWTFDAGGAGSSITINSIADGAASGTDIAVTCAAAHGLEVNDIVSISTGTAAYDGTHKVKAKISDTVFEVAAVFGSTATGVANQPATLICPAGGTGTYICTWSFDGSSAANNDIFDFALHQDGNHQSKSNGRHRFGGANEVTGLDRTCLLDIVAGEKISWMVRNTSGTGNITVRHINVVLTKL